MNRFLWVIQILLALLFLFAGAMKFIMPVEEMTKQMPSMSGGFLHFIGLCEILGGLALVLPGLFRTARWLTPLAAALLVIIMVGATWISLPGGAQMAVLPAITGVLLIVVAWGRRAER